MRLTLHRCVSALTLLTASACRNGNAPVIRPPTADFVLSAGDVYNMSTRKVELLGAGPQARPQLIGAGAAR